MQSALDQVFSEPLLAAMPQLSEKSHQGVPSSNPALYLGHEVCKSTTALGLRAALHLERVKSRYTGKERDSESGNDYFGARYYSSAMGRFMSPDWSPFPMPVPFALRENPQTLNLYNYVLNNPLKSVDRYGHYHCDPDTSKSTPNGIEVTAGACYFDPGDFHNVTVAKAQDWFNKHLNPAYKVMALAMKWNTDTQRLKDDKMLRDVSERTMLAIMSNPMQSNDSDFDKAAVTALVAEMDYDNVALYGIGADLQETIGLIEQFSPGSGTAVENAIKSGMDITEDSLSKTIQQAQGIKTE
jgi:RHS repeat-associated protein